MQREDTVAGREHGEKEIMPERVYAILIMC